MCTAVTKIPTIVKWSFESKHFISTEMGVYMYSHLLVHHRTSEQSMKITKLFA